MNLKKKYCPVCGGEVLFTYERPSTTFIINKTGSLSVYNNNFLEGPELIPHCENDREHEIIPHTNTKLYKLWEQWMDEVEGYFYDNNLGGVC